MKKLIGILAIAASFQGFSQKQQAYPYFGASHSTNPDATILEKGSVLVVPFSLGWEYLSDLPYIGVGAWVGTGKGFDIGLQTEISTDLNGEYLLLTPTIYVRKAIINKEHFKLSVGALIGLNYFTDFDLKDADMNGWFYNIPIFYSYKINENVGIYLNQSFYKGAECTGLKSSLGFVLLGKIYIDYSFYIVKCDYESYGTSFPPLRFAIGI